jgi:hypothetical protein
MKLEHPGPDGRDLSEDLGVNGCKMDVREVGKEDVRFQVLTAAIILRAVW